MKRLLVLILLLVLTVSACNGGAETPTATETGAPVTEALTEEPEPTATPEPAEEPTEEPAEEPTEEPEAFEPVVALEELVGEGLTAPVAMSVPDDGTDRLFIVDQIGLVYILDDQGTLIEEPFLDLRDRIVDLDPNYDERGLLGLAFHPDYADNGRLFIYYSAPLRSEAPEGWNHTSHLSEFTVSEDNSNGVDPATERLILQVDQPQSNHNSGSIVFGPDGHLYVPLGDGGGANDTGTGHVSDWYEVNEGGNGQAVGETLLGSILRLDVDDGDPYGIPEDNPFVGDEAGMDEAWAYGFRNPYRIIFDPGGDNELFVADAGQELWEEVSIVTAGGNYGWNVKEGTDCFSTAEPSNAGAITECPGEDPLGTPLTDPVIEFANSKQTEGLGLVIVGGAVYRGTDLSGWDGRYIFGHWSSSFRQAAGGLMVAARPAEDTGELWDFQLIEIANREGGELNEYLLAFGQDLAGEVYVLTSDSAGPSGDTGKVFRIASPEQVGTEIAMRNNEFQPRELTIAPGTRVTWVNEDAVLHTVTSGTRDEPTGMFDVEVATGETFFFTFDEPGTYDYYCSIHPGMDGTIIVEE
ncbi:MAG: PQQ-dependent sugar dehydrogenase [Anaerolineales bacterium]